MKSSSLLLQLIVSFFFPFRFLKVYVQTHNYYLIFQSKETPERDKDFLVILVLYYYTSFIINKTSVG